MRRKKKEKGLRLSTKLTAYAGVGPHYNTNIDARYTNIAQTWATLDCKANTNQNGVYDE